MERKKLTLPQSRKILVKAQPRDQLIDGVRKSGWQAVRDVQLPNLCSQLLPVVRLLDPYSSQVFRGPGEKNKLPL